MIDNFISSLFIIQTICCLGFVFLYNRDLAKERKELYDRLIAKDFKEYKLLNDPPEAKKKEEKEKYDFV